MFPTLQLGDGFARVNKDALAAVRELQQALKRAGFDVHCDGLYGPGTRQAVLAFQQQQQLVADGVVGSRTWRALKPWLTAPTPELEPSIMNDFRGDLTWVHKWEGHAGHPYWPGGESGVTLDPGFDLAHQSARALRKYYLSLDFHALNRLEAVIGKHGQAAKNALQTHNLGDIYISREQAARVFPLIADSYWREVCKRFERVKDPQTPACIQTVFLSLAYNRGPHNKHLHCLEPHVACGDWHNVAKQIATMQQNHELAGIRRRRHEEGTYIQDQLGHAGSAEVNLDLARLYHPN